MNKPMTAQHHAIYNAVFAEDSYRMIKAYFELYLDEIDCRTASNLLIESSEERIQNVPHDPTAPVWGEAEIALRRIAYNVIPQNTCIEFFGFLRAYLERFTLAAYHASRTSFTVSANDFAAIRYELAGHIFVRYQGKLRMKLDGAYVEITLEKHFKFGRVRPADEYKLLYASLYAPTGIKLREVALTELVWPDGVTVTRQ